METIFKNTGLTLLMIIMIMSLCSCPGLFKDTEYCIIKNKSDYTIDVFVDNEPKNTVTPGTTYQFGLYTEQSYSILCTSSALKWGPRKVKLIKGKPYTWTVNNPPEPTAPPEPTPEPKGEIRINNNSSYEVAIHISGIREENISANGNAEYTMAIGSYSLLAEPIGNEITGYWQEQIKLTENGYIWDLETSTETYPAENCNIWNFENNTADQTGLDNWNEKYNIAFSTQFKKFGNSCFLSDTYKLAYLIKNFTSAAIGESQSAAMWLKFSNLPGSENYNYCPLLTLGDRSANYFTLSLLRDVTNKVKPRIFVEKDNVATEILWSEYIEQDIWYYLAFCYNKNTDVLYLICNNEYSSVNLAGTWDNDELGTHMALTIYSYNYASATITCIDEAIMIANQFVNPQVFINHYNNNFYWGEEYIP